LPTFQKSLQTCADYKSLGKITRNLIQSLATVAFPGEQLALLPYRDPQDSQVSLSDERNSQNLVMLTTSEAKRFELAYNEQIAQKKVTLVGIE
jgi:hypothetical protein